MPDELQADPATVCDGERGNDDPSAHDGGPEAEAAQPRRSKRGRGIKGAIQFAVTKLFGTGSQVPFFAAITSRYRKLMGSITERVISGSNSNSPNNTG
jgi:hypothetical protein